MLTIIVPDKEWFDEDTEQFVSIKGAVLQMEHSLIALSKWESKWKKSFLDKLDSLTPEEMIDYFRCMSINSKADPSVYAAIWNDFELRNKVMDYINDSMSAVKFKEDKEGPHSSIKDSLTSDIIYYWMVANQIPFDCEKWHVNRLISLVRICGIKNNAGNKTMSKADLMRRNKDLNSARRSKMHSRG